MTPLAEVQFPFIRVKARDWALTEGQYRVDGAWNPVVGYISGWLICETEDAIAIGQQLFYKSGDEAHWQTRYTITIPKETVLERIDSPAPCPLSLEEDS